MRFTLRWRRAAALLVLLCHLPTALSTRRVDELTGWKGEVHRTKVHRAAAIPRATSLTATFKRSANGADSPAVKSATLIIGADRPALSHHASTIVETSPGHFLAAWFGGTFEGKSDVSIYTARLANTSGTWGDVQLVVRTMGRATWNPVLHRLRSSSDVLLFYKVGRTPSTWRGRYKRSRDGGLTWGAAVELPDDVVGPAKNKCIETEAELLCPSSVEGGPEGKTWTAWVESTADEGATWQRHGPIEYQGKIIQPSLWVGADGRVHLIARTRAQYAALAVADKSGHKWGRVKLSSAACPNSGLDAVRTRTGALYMVYNDSRLNGIIARSKLVLSVSRDEGESWEERVVLEDTGAHANEFSYPAIIEAADGLLHITYTWKRLNIKHVIVDVELL